ncbi:MAG: SRPBCC family protein, partial [Polyangiaceae bacterium]
MGFAVASCGGAIPTPQSALAPPPPPLERLDGPATREAVAIEGSDLVRGRSRVVVRASMAKVRRYVLDFDHYAEFMPHYRQSRILILR